MKAVWERYLGLKRLFKIKWSSQARKQLRKEQWPDPRIGSPTFFRLWTIEKKRKTPKELLHLFVTLLVLEELTGEVTQTKDLLARFHPSLAPDAPLWKEIAELVNLAFPKSELKEKNAFARQIHQLRYVISSQQAEYIRKHYRKGKMTDAQALASYLKSRPFTHRESARLHNKLRFDKEKKYYPDNKRSYNIKILQYFHTEFILSSQGRFLNELDPEGQTEAGVVNGASFNYANRNNKRHWELDVDPIGIHDPAFRKKISKPFKSPSLVTYRSARSLFSSQGKSRLSQVKRVAKQFTKTVHRA